jgi:hypothetical protein
MEPDSLVFGRNALKGPLRPGSCRRPDGAVAVSGASRRLDRVFAGFEASRERASGLRRETLSRWRPPRAVHRGAEKRGTVVTWRATPPRRRESPPATRGRRGSRWPSARNRPPRRRSRGRRPPERGIGEEETDLGGYVAASRGAAVPHPVFAIPHDAGSVTRVFERKLGSRPGDAGAFGDRAGSSWKEASPGRSGVSGRTSWSQRRDRRPAVERGNAPRERCLPRVHLFVCWDRECGPRTPTCIPPAAAVAQRQGGGSRTPLLSIHTGPRGRRRGRTAPAALLLIDCGPARSSKESTCARAQLHPCGRALPQPRCTARGRAPVTLGVPRPIGAV